MVNWQVILSKQAAKDAKRLSNSGLKDKAQAILIILQENPFEPPYELTYSPRLKAWGVCQGCGLIMNNSIEMNETPLNRSSD
jgi:mRNA-degrading endonuclease RelE of RelBE toxin-antitoxin system